MDTKEMDRSYVAGTYGRYDVALTEGSGAGYTGEDGKTYIDFVSGIGVNLFGACDPEWVGAVEKQLHTMGHVSNLYYSAPQAELARLLCGRTGMKKVFFSNSGAEANECALKVARKYGNDRSDGQRHVIITLIDSFHGRTLGTLAATGQDMFHQHFGPFPEGFRYVPANDIEALKAAFAPGDVCGVLMEMVQGEGGVHVLEQDYVQAARGLCTEHDALMMVDEVQTGNGRTGSLYAYMQYGIQPDVFTTAKALAGGLPMGACLLGDKAEFVLGKGDHGSTFGGNPICAAAAVNVISRIDDALLAGVRERHDYIVKEMTGVPGVKSISGLGLLVGIETEKPAGEVAAACNRDGLMVLTAHHNKIRMLPPLNISYEELQQGLDILKAHL